MGEIERAETMPLVQADSATEVGRLLELAINKDLDADKLERLVAMKERMEDRQAAQEFNAAFGRFQDQCPTIVKNKTAKIATKSGASFGYRYADLEQVAKLLREPLRDNGLSYSFDTEQGERSIVVTCQVRHIGGHCEQSTVTIPIDTGARMSMAQTVGSAMMYAKRNALINALGLTACDDADDDGAGGESDPEPITAAQVVELEQLIADSGADRVRFLKFAGVSDLEQITSGAFPGIKSKLLDKLTATMIGGDDDNA